RPHHAPRARLSPSTRGRAAPVGRARDRLLDGKRPGAVASPLGASLLHVASARLCAPVLALASLALAAPAGAQDMNIALSRLSEPGSCDDGTCARDDDAYRFVMSELAG